MSQYIMSHLICEFSYNFMEIESRPGFGAVTGQYLKCCFGIARSAGPTSVSSEVDILNMRCPLKLLVEKGYANFRQLLKQISF